MKLLILGIVLTLVSQGVVVSQPIEDPNHTQRTMSSQTATDLNYPEPKHVLVVYKTPSSQSDSIGLISKDVKDYYINKYDIPSQNVVGLTLPDEVTYEGHVVRLYRKAEIIKDTTSAWYDNPDTHAWEYYIDYISDPIKSRLDSVVIAGDTLKNTIRYIVLCYGIPFKIQARRDWAGFLLTRQNVALDGLLTILYHPNILDLWNTAYDDENYENPFWRSDRYYNFNMRFEPHHFLNDSGLVLNYLVSRLDALDYETIEGMIDKSADPDYSGERTWILDGGGPGTNDITAAYNELDANEFVTEYNNSSQIWIIESDDSVIAYTSAGTHQGMDSNYIQATLNFNYANSSIFNTYESFNANSIRTLTRRAGQGLLTEFFLTGGTAGAGHTWEPTTGTVSHDSLWFPGYAMGYSITDAMFKGMEYLAFQNVLVGDPLSAIAWGKQTLTQDITWQGTNLVTDTIDIPIAKTLTIPSGAVINLKHHGFITGDGDLIVDNNVTFNVSDWQHALFLAKENNHPKLVWGVHPNVPPVNGFKIYRQIDNGSWDFLTQTNNTYYLDEYVSITPPAGGVSHYFNYKITAIIDLTTESEYSNTVDINGDLKSRKIAGDSNTENKFTYYLTQNYPNPFNPTTTIGFSTKKAGLVTIKIYNILGKEVVTLVNENKTAGNYSVKFNASNLPSGIYFYRLKSGSFSATKKLILLK